MAAAFTDPARWWIEKRRRTGRWSVWPPVVNGSFPYGIDLRSFDTFEQARQHYLEQVSA